MHYNVFGEKVSRARYKLMLQALKNRQELIAAGLTSRRDLLKMGLLTSPGYLIAKGGLSARAQSTSSLLPAGQCSSPATTPFTMPLSFF